MQTNIYDFEQGSSEWFDIRKLRATASKAQAIASAGKGLDSLIIDKLAEYIDGDVEYYTNENMERGNELESLARIDYEFSTGRVVKEVGFYTYGDYAGCSPDGVCDDRLIEIKCPKTTTYLRYKFDRKIDTKYMWQMQMQMLITGKSKCDYVVYHEKQGSIIQEVKADKDMQSKIVKGISQYEKAIKDKLQRIK